MNHSLVRQWILAPISNYRLFHNFTRQDFFAQFSASIGGFLWLFLTPIVHIIIYSFVFSYIFQIRTFGEFGETQFILFMMIGYLPWFAFAEAMSKSTGLLLEKAPLITKVMFPVQIVPIVGTVVPYLTHAIGFGVLLVYLAIQGHLNENQQPRAEPTPDARAGAPLDPPGPSMQRPPRRPPSLDSGRSRAGP